jgi:predicted TIM-barrel fold metal-dependent hydrolase
MRSGTIEHGGPVSTLSRRDVLGNLVVALAAPQLAGAGPLIADAGDATGKPLSLTDFQPKSMLHVPQTAVARARFPVIDIHTHISWLAAHDHGVAVGEKMTYLAPPSELLPVMDRRNVRMMVDLTGGFGAGLAETIERYQRPHPDRFAIFTTPCWERIQESNYPQYQAGQIMAAHRAGARGLKIEKILGLYLREQVGTGPLVKVDDRRFDPMWEACGAAGIPVAIHVSDPEAFFLPVDRFNERFEELNNHPSWSFYGRDFPSNQELLEARNRVFARHPRTQFITLHVGNNAENLADVSDCLDRFQNMHVDLAARIGELGRQPCAARKFFEKYQDRIIFGTDAVPHTTSTPQQLFGDELYEIYFRFLETEDEYFDYAPAHKPPQGRWQIYGIGLPETILKKVYYQNAARLLGVKIE